MGVDLIGERFDSGREQQLFLLLQAMLDPRVVPDLDRRRHCQNRRKQDDDHHPRRARPQIEQAVRVAPAGAESLTEELERDGRQQQDHLPVHLEAPQHLPRAPGQAREDKRREVPDRFFRAQLAQTAAREPAADREGECDEFAVAERTYPDDRADCCAGVRPGDQPGEERPLECQVGGVVL